jgi:hypothetical protein
LASVAASSVAAATSVLVLCEDFDPAAAWAADRLRRRGLDANVVYGTDLAAAPQVEHRVGRAGATIEIMLACGRRLSSRTIGGVLNRLSFLPSAWLNRIGGPDRDYAVQEMYALYLSWLNSLPGPLLNPPAPQGLCGNWRHPSAWAALAGRAGLPVARYRQSSEDDPAALWPAAAAVAPATLFVVGERVVGQPAALEHLDEPCRRLALAANVRLLGIDFAPSANGWHFVGASVMPDLIRGGEPLADALAQALSP